MHANVVSDCASRGPRRRGWFFRGQSTQMSILNGHSDILLDTEQAHIFVISHLVVHLFIY